MIQNKHNCYIAGPWFTPEADEIIEQIKTTLLGLDQNYFSPKDDCLFEPGTMTPQGVLDVNVEAMKHTDYVICVTDGQDPGTMFEAGWSYAMKVPIIYLWLGGKPKDKFNLVLAASGAVTRSYEQLAEAVSDFNDGTLEIRNYGEEPEYE